MCSAETRLGLSSFAINTESELEVRSDSMIFDSESQSTKFIDNVFIKFDKLTLKADSVKILQTEMKLFRAILDEIKLESNNPLSQ